MNDYITPIKRKIPKENSSDKYYLENLDTPILLTLI